MAGASGDGHTWAARLAGDDRTLIDDDEFAVESLLQIDTAAGVRATTRARRDVYQPLLKPHARFNRWSCRRESPSTCRASSVLTRPAKSQPTTCARLCSLLFNVILSLIV